MKISVSGAVTLCGAVWAASAGAAVTTTPRYVCERGVEIPAVYVDYEGGSEPRVVVITVEGRLITLQATTEAASGIRYRFPNGGSDCIWWTHQGEARLIWYEAEVKEEALRLL